MSSVFFSREAASEKHVHNMYYANKVDQKAPMDQDGAEEMKGFDVRRRRGAGGAAGEHAGRHWEF